MAQERPTVIDLFSGCGGASLGFTLEGYEVLCAVDLDEAACRTYRSNLGIDPLIEDIGKISGKDILRHTGLAKHEPTVVIGCPPCQGFTRLRKKKIDKRNNLIMSLVNIVDEIRPNFLVFENVPGILNVAHGRYFRYLCDRLRKMGYEYVHAILDAVNYGVPQFRKRFILLAAESRFPVPRLPAWTHARPADASRFDLETWVTVRDAIGDVPRIDSGQKHSILANHQARAHSELVLKRISEVPKDGGSRKTLAKRLWLKCHSSKSDTVGFNDVYGRLRWDMPSVTITSGCTNPSKGRFIHPDQDRGLTPREAARLQSFPDRKWPIAWFTRDFVFFGDYGDVSSQIGNALPVRLAISLAQAVRYAFGSA